MKELILLLLTATLLCARSGAVDVYSSRDMQAQGQKLADKRGQFGSEDLARYGNHYTLLAVRNKTGSSEVHLREADIFIVESGEATLLSGGELVNPKTTKPGEIRGTSLKGGERRTVGAGDIIHIPAGTPHQLLVENGKPFVYFVIKVMGQ